MIMLTFKNFKTLYLFSKSFKRTIQMWVKSKRKHNVIKVMWAEKQYVYRWFGNNENGFSLK